MEKEANRECECELAEERELIEKERILQKEEL